MSWPSVSFYLVTILHVLEKNEYSPVLDGVFYLCQFDQIDL